MMRPIILTLICSLFVQTAAMAAEPKSDPGGTREELLLRIDRLQEAAIGLEHIIDPGSFEKLRRDIRTLDEVQLGLIELGMTQQKLHGLPQAPEPDSIVFPDPEIPGVCEAITPGLGFGLFAVAATLKEILAIAKWACLQTAVGTNTATACAVVNVATVTADWLFKDSALCLTVARTATQIAVFETDGNIAGHLNQYVDANVSSLATQSSLNQLQNGLTQEVTDLNSLANSLASDLSSLSADLADTSNQVESLTSATVNMTAVSEDIRFKSLVTLAEAEEIDELAADSQQRLDIVRDKTQQIINSSQVLQQMIGDLNHTSMNQIERELDASVARAMADPNVNIVEYKLPSAMNGELERSREVLVRAIQAYNEIGADTSSATQYLTMGDTQFNLGRYLTAYSHFSRAYQLLLNSADTLEKDS